MTSIYQYDDTDMLKTVNKTFCIVVDSLREEEFLTQEQADKLHTHYSMIVENKTWIPDFLAKWLGLKDDSVKLRLVKAIGRVKSK